MKNGYGSPPPPPPLGRGEKGREKERIMYGVNCGKILTISYLGFVENFFIGFICSTIHVLAVVYPPQSCDCVRFLSTFSSCSMKMTSHIRD